MVEALSLPEIPPGNVWDLYILFLIVPVLLRVLLLTKPFLEVTKQLAPHGGWIIKRLKQLPIKGLGIIAFNEVMAFCLPVIMVLIFRMFSNGLGWDTWGETSIFGLIIVLMFGSIWIFLDLIRIARIRRMLKAIQKRNLDNLRKAADVGLGVRSWLQRFSKRNEKPVERVSKSVGKRWGLVAWRARKITPSGLVVAVATGVAIEAARLGAGKVTDIIDEKMQEEFDKIASSNTNLLMILFLRDLAMGIAPLLILWAVPSIFA